MTNKGAPRGERRRLPTYQRGCGRPYRPGTYFRPETAEKLLDLCDRTGLSVAGFLDLLIERLPIDEKTGTPIGWSQQRPQQEEIKELPNASGF